MVCRERDWAIAVYSIGVASRLSGVPAETIRIWERRYGLPNPGRSTGGHRLYSEPDVELLRAVKHLVDQGVRVGGLAKMGRDQILESAFGQSDASESPPPPSNDFSDLIADGVMAARDLDTNRLSELLSRPLLNLHAAQVVRDFYLPLLREVGDLWHAGEISIASEHLVEKQISGRIHSVLANRRSASRDAPQVVCACVASERHEVGLLASSVVLLEAGFRVLYLGADLPADELLSVVEHAHPALIVLASAMPMPPTEQDELVRVLDNAAFDRLPIALGGMNAGPLSMALGRPVNLCEDVSDLSALAQSIVSAS